MLASAALARNIRAGRGLRGMKQEDLAQAMTRLGHPWTDSTVSAVEGGRRQVAVDELPALAAVLGYVLPDLLVPADPERLDVGPHMMRAQFVQWWLKGDVKVLLRWDEEGKALPPDIMTRVFDILGRVDMDITPDVLRTAIETRNQ